MKQMKFEQINETLYHEKLDNGLDVYILPKEGFQKTYATFTTKYGSIDNHFTPLGETEPLKVPDGIAHFLEHKLFEKEDGDVFQQFSVQGASANAFTTFNRTAYLFSSTSNVEQNMETLLDFVQEPYFTEKTVEKEKGIIGQEITMYDDNPDWRLYFGMIDNMYHHHPVGIDIAGTVESISKVTDKLLYTCYNTFYHPSNMLFFVVGAVDPESMMTFIKENQNKKTFAEPEKIQRFFEEEPDAVAEAKKVLKMNVQTPKGLTGVKANKPVENGEALLKREISTNIYLDVLFGKSAKAYFDLYNEGLIDDTFSYDYSQEEGYGFATIGGDTDNPDQLHEKITTVLKSAVKGEGLSEEAVERSKKKKIGGFLRSLNSPEYIANQFTRYAFNEMDLFKVLETLESVSLKDIEEVANSFYEENRVTNCQVVPLD
ncbi:EF-P 5-aminopentanol modification-associated protein YfmH [Mangrovibacillus cuniculi]|uniref:Insulinase family protein n=1 Tax=Mangrovibacillus cuniculi TaxID=2593652 RepID=A0A7S8CAR2_9BACI|nr:pitrilysin family protein [Mangrovibacillus cuniculi]QPC46406.1 insulinase family protein [Mangrovibacillus cuniculi]